MNSLYRVVIILYLLVDVFGCSNSLELEKLWIEHKRRYSLKFRREEDLRRKFIFEENMKYINEHNSKGKSFTLGMNHFGHLSNEEFDEMFPAVDRSEVLSDYKSLNDDKKKRTHETLSQSIPPEKLAVDYRLLLLVTPVKDQLQCGAGYAFASIVALEAMYKLNEGRLLSLSEQNVIDCSYFYYRNFGCAGGNVLNSMYYMQDYGATTSANYPYTGKTDICKDTKFNFTASAKEILVITPDDEAKFSLDITQYGPAATGVFVNNDFKYYKGGLFNSTTCEEKINHAVAVVGLDIDPPIYIVKNSFGENWGQKGYMNFLRMNKNMCQIATQGAIILDTA